MTQHLIPRHTSLFESIKQSENGRDLWSARDLQTLLAYTEWRNFEETIKRAMISCQVAGQAVSDHFGETTKMIDLAKGARRRVKDYHLTRFACYSIAMNGDVEKPSIAQAQQYFAIKSREAELAQEASHPNIHRLSDAMKPRALENLHRVPEGYFSVLSELFRHLYNLEAILDQALDGEAILEESVGLHWSRYAREELDIPNQARIKYLHLCPTGRAVWAWAYPNTYLTAFTKWLWGHYFPTHFPTYQYRRAQFLARHSKLPARRHKKSLR